MDYHVIIVIACVFLASLFSILFINKFFKNKTYEEAAAEKKALVEKLYPSTKGPKKVKKISIKKDLKKDKKSRQSVKDSTENEQESGDDNQDDIEEIESTSAAESSPNPQHSVKVKPHVEFSQQQNVSNDHHKDVPVDVKGNKQSKKQKTNKTGILVNKTEVSPVLQDSASNENLNHFEKQHPKDVIELKKQHKEEHNNATQNDNKNKNVKDNKKINKNVKKESNENVPSGVETITVHHAPAPSHALEQRITAKTLEHATIKAESPKSQSNKKSKSKASAANKDIALFEKLGQNDVIGVNYLIQLFSKAELNRNDIQILIDYLLNKQQDTAEVTHEWSDDIVTKLKKQLSEKEKALQDEIDASVGIQAKLKDLRTEINTERAQFNANIKAYTDELQSKKTEISLLQTEIQNLNEKMQLERQQMQAKLRHEKEASNQSLLNQIQQLNEHNTMLQNEIVQKSTFINDLQILTNASHQNIEEHKQKFNEINEIYQQKLNQIQTLENGLKEANETITRLKYDLDMAKISEKEKENGIVEIKNLQNALESNKTELDTTNTKLNESNKKYNELIKELNEIRNQYSSLNTKYQEISSESESVKDSLENYKQIVAEKDSKLDDLENKMKSLAGREDDLMKQLSEQKEKNNDLRTKNWKLNEALQTAETNAKKIMASNNKTNSLGISPLQSTSKSGHSADQQQKLIRDIFEKLFPESVKKHSSTALSVSFDQWIEQVIQSHIEDLTKKLEVKFAENNINKNTENLNNNKNHNNSHNHNSSDKSSNNNNESDVRIHHSSSNDSKDNIASNKLSAQVDELQSKVTKTEVEEDNQHQIDVLQSSNGNK